MLPIYYFIFYYNFFAFREVLTLNRDFDFGDSDKQHLNINYTKCIQGLNFFFEVGNCKIYGGRTLVRIQCIPFAQKEKFFLYLWCLIACQVIYLQTVVGGFLLAITTFGVVQFLNASSCLFSYYYDSKERWCTYLYGAPVLWCMW